MVFYLVEAVNRIFGFGQDFAERDVRMKGPTRLLEELESD